jgi:nucleoside-diphosphate-sugar epimerase
LKILVTGASGGLGQWVIKELLANGHSVVGVDLRPPSKALCPSLIVDLTSAGEVYSAISDTRPEGIVNLAAFPKPGITSARRTFLTNVETAYNVFEAAAALDVKKVVHASTDSSYGLIFAKHPITPLYLPIDEDHPQRPQDCYGGSKMLNEYTARIFANANPQMQFTCIRICWLFAPDELANFSPSDDTLESVCSLANGLFAYIEMRDAAAGFRLAMEKDMPGFDVFNIMANDTLTVIETKRLVAHYYPNTEVRKEFNGNEGLYSTEKAARVLGWRQQYTWRKSNNEV